MRFLNARLSCMLQNEIIVVVPLSLAVLSKEWICAWKCGSSHINHEIQIVHMDKSDAFDRRIYFPALKCMIDKNLLMAPAPGVADVENKKVSIQADEFKLLMT